MKTKPITYDELADLYKKHTGHNARIRPMEEVVDWAVNNPLFVVDKDDNICLKEHERTN